MKRIFFDLETTGFKNDDEILSMAFVDQEENVLLDTYVRPIYKEKWSEAEKINHLTYEMVKDAPTMNELQERVNAIVDSADVLISYGINFDYRFIKQWLYPHVQQDVKTHCCLTEAKRKYPYMSHKLCDMMDFFGIEWTGNSHSALPDTIACKDVWMAMNDKNK